MKGQQKIRRGTGFRGAMQYDLDHDRPQIVGGNMSGANARDLAREFGQSRRLREDIQKPVWRNSLSLPEGETLTPDEWAQFADDYMSEMGFDDDHQRIYIVHNKPGQQHLHITASRISMSGRVYLGQNENLKSTKIIHDLEKKYGLTPTPSGTTPKPRRAPKKPEIDKACRTLTKPPRTELADLVDKCLSTDKPKTPEALKNALAARGVETVFFMEDEKIQGITFSMGGLKFSGRALGPDYKWSKILERMAADDKTRPDQKLTHAAGNVPGHPDTQSPSPKNSNFGKKGLAPRSGKKATPAQNQAFQTLLKKEKIMNDAQMIGALSHARSAQPEDKDNVEHGWSEWTDKNGRVWFYDADQPPRVGNRAGYSWDPSGGPDGPPAIRVWDCAVERHGIEQAAVDAVRICVFKSLPEPLRLHGTPEFQRAAAREMHRLGLALKNEDGPGREEYDRLTREKEKDTQEQVNAISSVFSQIDDQANRAHRAILARTAEMMEDTPSKKDDRMRLRGPR